MTKETLLRIQSYVLVILAAAFVLFCAFGLQGCTSMDFKAAVTSDCELAPDLMQPETVTPLPSKDTSLVELREELTKHLAHEKAIVGRSNDKTDFVRTHCQATGRTAAAPPAAAQ